MTITGIRDGGIGEPVLRKEDLRLLTGEGSYTDDVALPNQVHAVIVRSPHAHARIVSVDVARALEMPGVLAVLTGADLEPDGIGAIPDQANMRGLVDVAMDNTDGSPRLFSPIPLLSSDKARFVGNAVAAVVAESIAAASDGAELVEVTYEPLPTVIATDRAADADAPLVWDELDTNTMVDAVFGDPEATDAAFENAEFVIDLTHANQPRDRRHVGAAIGAVRLRRGRWPIHDVLRRGQLGSAQARHRHGSWAYRKSRSS